MESSQEFMLLSLLNLYATYADVKSGRIRTPEKRTYQKHKLWNKQLPTTKHMSSTELPATVSTVKVENEVAPFTQQESELQVTTASVETSIDSNRPVTTKREKKSRGKGKKKRDLNRKPRTRRWAVRPTNRDRALTGYHRKVFATIKKMDQEQFFLHTRMSKPIFDWLLSFMQKSLKKKRQKISAEERLAITLEYLAYGTAMQSIAFKHKLGKSTIRIIILETCSLLWELLSPIYVSEPTTSQYYDIADDFKTKWNIPNCVGAIDGKHVSIRVPHKKKTTLASGNTDESMLLMGVCDSKYKFTAVSVGDVNNQNDEVAFQTSPFGSAIITNQLPLPSSKPLFDSSPPFPHYFINNNSLSLRRNIMRPYAQTVTDTNKTIFNYKILRALAITENTFGVLTARWRVLSTTIEFLPESCETIILACVALHNYIVANDDDQLYCPVNFVDREGEYGNIELGEWRNELKNNGNQPLRSMALNAGRSTYEANNLRDILANALANEAISYEVDFVESNQL